MPRPNSQSVAGARKHCRVAISKQSISAPSPNRSPLKVNVYEFAKDPATTLAPLFPYFDAGSIVPCLSVFRGGPLDDLFEYPATLGARTSASP